MRNKITSTGDKSVSLTHVVIETIVLFIAGEIWAVCLHIFQIKLQIIVFVALRRWQLHIIRYELRLQSLFRELSGVFYKHRHVSSNGSRCVALKRNTQRQVGESYFQYKPAETSDFGSPKAILTRFRQRSNPNSRAPDNSCSARMNTQRYPYRFCLRIVACWFVHWVRLGGQTTV